MNRKAITVADTTTIAVLNDDYDLWAECPCGHKVQIFTLWLRRQLGAGVTDGAVRAKLKCSRCNGRNPPIQIYRRLE